MDATKTKPFNIDKKLVYDAYKAVKVNAGAAGVDGQSLEQFAQDLGRNLYKIWNRMSSGSYFPPPVRAVPIPKKNGDNAFWGCPQWPIVWRRWSSSKSWKELWNQSSCQTHMATGPTSRRWMPSG